MVKVALSRQRHMTCLRSETQSMNNACPTPGCDAVYSITPQHIGKRFQCKKCAASLVVTDYGLQLDTGAFVAGPGPTVGAAAEAGLQGVPAAPSGPNFWTQFRAKLVDFADLPTWLFGIGAFLVIVYLFFPLIDQAKVERRKARVTFGDARERRLEAELQKKEKSTDEEKERRKKDREKWEKEKSDLEADVEAAQMAQRRATYWYFYGTMLGFVLLAFGALGYLDPRQPVIRRVLGCIVLVALLLSIFIGLTRVGIRVDIGGR